MSPQIAPRGTASDPSSRHGRRGWHIHHDNRRPGGVRLPLREHDPGPASEYDGHTHDPRNLRFIKEPTPRTLHADSDSDSTSRQFLAARGADDPGRPPPSAQGRASIAAAQPTPRLPCGRCREGAPCSPDRAPSIARTRSRYSPADAHEAPTGLLLRPRRRQAPRALPRRHGQAGRARRASPKRSRRSAKARAYPSLLPVRGSLLPQSESLARSRRAWPRRAGIAHARVSQRGAGHSR